MGHETSVPSFTPPSGPARWARGLLFATAVLALVAAGSSAAQYELLGRIDGGDFSMEEANANDSRQAGIGMVQVAFYLATAIAFLTWMHRAHKNLPSLGSRDLQYTPGWAVGGFFVPFLNLVRPLQVMREIWLGSDPAGVERDRGADGAAARTALGTPPLVGWWWGFFIANGIIGNVLARMSFAPDQSVDDLQSLTSLILVSDVLEIPGALLAAGVVGQITRWQGERHDRAQQLGDIAA